jgi:4-diphosphocytidyl-2-C-methyl-D-erythritol kinase
MRALSVAAPAKINLFLQVIGRRQDGYHELRTLMCCVGLYDRLHLRFGTRSNEFFCKYPQVPSDGRNLACRAAECFNKHLAAETNSIAQNLSIQLIKSIPAGGGLGGGSSDAAAVLKACNRFYGEPFNRDRLTAMALTLGADVPFFIDQVPALATGVGEKLSPYDGLSPLGVVLVYPGFGISTAEVFKNLNLRLTKCEKKIRYFSFINEKFSATRHLCNDLESAVVERFPIIKRIKKELLDKGAMGALMTGSGSTVFGLFANLADARAAARLLKRQNGWRIFSTQIVC